MRPLVLAFALAVLGVAACGDDPCSRLDDMCSACPDADLKSACEVAANTPLVSTDETCQDELDSGKFNRCQ